MARKILFRGFHECENGTEIVVVNGKEHKGEWREGHLIAGADITLIVPKGKEFSWCKEEDFTFGITAYEVITETVGQYTGLTDINDKNIFDKDKIIYGERIDYDLYKESVANPEEYNGIIFDKGIIEDVVVWCGENGYPAFDLKNHDMDCNALSEISAGDYFIGVIGTIFDKEDLI